MFPAIPELRSSIVNGASSDPVLLPLSVSVECLCAVQWELDSAWEASMLGYDLRRAYLPTFGIAELLEIANDLSQLVELQITGTLQEQPEGFP